MTLQSTLEDISSIESNLFVKIEIDYYKANPGDTATSTDLLFSDRIQSTTIGTDTYLGLGKLVSIGTSKSELRVAGDDVVIVITGIPNSSISEIVNSRIKGSPVTIYRALFNTTTNQLITFSGSGSNPMIRFKGYVNNLSLEEEYDVENRTSSNTLVLNCSSVVDILQNKISGRKTNPTSMKKFYSTDISMDRVPTLENSFFDFGAKK